MQRRFIWVLSLTLITFLLLLTVVLWGRSPIPVQAASLPAHQSVSSQPNSTNTLPRYAIGNPITQTIWVDPINGNNSNNGSARNQALKTISAAWDKIPAGAILTGTGYRIMLVAGLYTGAGQLPNLWAERRGTAQFPIMIQSADGIGSARLEGEMNLKNLSYVYWLGLTIKHHQRVFHCESCDHILLRDSTFIGSRNDLQSMWDVRFTQSQDIFVENNIITATYDTGLHFMAVQRGHIVGNQIGGAREWCLTVNGGSAYLQIEGNRLYQCDNVGFSVGGDSSQIELMGQSWLHYEAYDVRFVNNIIQNTNNIGMAIYGGYDILLAYNTLYQVGKDNTLLDFTQGDRLCDEQSLVAECVANVNAGGWGPKSTADDSEPIPNRNIHVVNNIFYNPAGYVSPQHFYVEGYIEPSSSKIPDPALADDHVVIKSNIIWNVTNGFITATLGIDPNEDPELQGCLPNNPTCNPTQLNLDNQINKLQPQLIDPENGDFRLAVSLGGLVGAIPTYPAWDILTPTVPAGTMAPSVANDRDGNIRSGNDSPGAYGFAAQAPTKTPIPTSTATPNPVFTALTPPPTLTNTPTATFTEVPLNETPTSTPVPPGSTATPTPMQKIYLPSVSK